MRNQENNHILASYELAWQVKANIDRLCSENQQNPEALEESIIPTEVLYKIATALVALVDVSYDAALLRGGYHQTHTRIQ